MKTMFVMFVVILFSGMNMVWGEELCKETRGVEVEIKNQSYSSQEVTVELTNYQAYLTTVKFYLIKGDKIVSDTFEKNVPAAKPDGTPFTRVEKVKANVNGGDLKVEIYKTYKCL